MTTTPQVTVSEEGDDLNLDAFAILEFLQVDLARVEAVAHAAFGALEFLPSVQRSEDVRGLGRVHALVTITAEEAFSLAEDVGAKVARLSARMAARNAKAESQDSPSTEAEKGE